MATTPLERGSGDHQWCDARIAALETENALLRACVQGLEEQQNRHAVQLQKLEARVRQNSQNSSRPPSSDAPSTPPSPKKPPSARKPGGQPGHPPHMRELFPRERVTRFVEKKPDVCKHCGRPLEGHDSCPRKLQVVEPPKMEPEVTEYGLHSLWCSACEKQTEASLPPGVPSGARCDTVTLGPRAQALLAACTGVYHMSKRATARFFQDVFHIDISAASVCAAEATVSDAVEKPVAEAHEYVQQQAALSADETGSREGRKKAWLWVAVTPLVTIFLVNLSRGRAAARKLLGNFSGTLGSDRWIAYSHWVVEKRQLCWAHILRHFKAFSEARGTSRRIGLALLEEGRQMFHWWHKVRDGTLKRSTFKRYMGPCKKRVNALLVEATACRQPFAAATARELLKLEPALWTFISTEGIEPTNNAAERAIRPAVLWRKVSFGTHSARGSRFMERILTVSATLKQQRRDVLDYLTRACIARLTGEKPPSLLPPAVTPAVLCA